MPSIGDAFGDDFQRLGDAHDGDDQRLGRTVGQSLAGRRINFISRIEGNSGLSQRTGHRDRGCDELPRLAVGDEYDSDRLRCGRAGRSRDCRRELAGRGTGRQQPTEDEHQGQMSSTPPGRPFYVLQA